MYSEVEILKFGVNFQQREEAKPGQEPQEAPLYRSNHTIMRQLPCILASFTLRRKVVSNRNVSRARRIGSMALNLPKMFYDLDLVERVAESDEAIESLSKDHPILLENSNWCVRYVKMYDWLAFSIFWIMVSKVFGNISFRLSQGSILYVLIA